MTDAHPFTAAVLTISDRCSQGDAQDTSGPALVQLLTDTFGADVRSTKCVPDEIDRIRATIRAWADTHIDLVLTTGGTGLAPRDVTPEAIAPLLDKPAPNLLELARLRCLEKTANAYLSRGVAGVVHKTLVITLPGSRTGATETLEALADILAHAIDAMKDRDTHPPPASPTPGPTLDPTQT
jgi:molybdenum cofactor synthesis domain-containing protein